MDVKQIWEMHQLKLDYFIRSRVKNNCFAKDIYQDVYLKLHQNIHTLKDPQKIGPWLYQITRNTIIDYYREHHILEQLPEELGTKGKDENDWEVISLCVRPFIEELNEKYRDVLLLSEIDQYTASEVAEKLGITLTNAKSRILRGKTQLKKKFEDCCIFDCGPRGAHLDTDDFEDEK